MVRVNGIQANLSNPLLGVEGERYEADNVVVDQGNIDRLMRFRVAHARQMLSLFGISPCESESRYCLADNFPEGAKDRLKGECAYPLNHLQIGGPKGLIYTFVAMDTPEPAFAFVSADQQDPTGMSEIKETTMATKWYAPIRSGSFAETVPHPRQPAARTTATGGELSLA
jgi:hypothetical protein